MASMEALFFLSIGAIVEAGGGLGCLADAHTCPVLPDAACDAFVDKIHVPKNAAVRVTAAPVTDISRALEVSDNRCVFCATFQYAKFFWAQLSDVCSKKKTHTRSTDILSMMSLFSGGRDAREDSDVAEDAHNMFQWIREVMRVPAVTIPKNFWQLVKGWALCMLSAKLELMATGICHNGHKQKEDKTYATRMMTINAQNISLVHMKKIMPEGMKFDVSLITRVAIREEFNKEKMRFPDSCTICKTKIRINGLHLMESPSVLFVKFTSKPEKSIIGHMLPRLVRVNLLHSTGDDPTTDPADFMVSMILFHHKACIKEKTPAHFSFKMCHVSKSSGKKWVVTWFHVKQGHLEEVPHDDSLFRQDDVFAFGCVLQSMKFGHIEPETPPTTVPACGAPLEAIGAPLKAPTRKRGFSKKRSSVGGGGGGGGGGNGGGGGEKRKRKKSSGESK